MPFCYCSDDLGKSGAGVQGVDRFPRRLQVNQSFVKGRPSESLGKSNVTYDVTDE